MARVFILTDSTAQFPQPSFPGQELVNILPLRFQLGSQSLKDGNALNLNDLPISARHSAGAISLPPSPDDFHQAFLGLQDQASEVIAILVSAQLIPVVPRAQEAAAHSPGSLPVSVIDSQTSGIGLGLVVQSAAEAARSGASAAEIKQFIRKQITHVYTLFTLQSLTYLALAGHLDPTQALVGEMLGITSVYILENGRLIPIQKARNTRHLLDLLHEFVTEFGDLKHIALLKGRLPFEGEARSLRERIGLSFPTAPYSEHTMNTALAGIIGPRSLGLVAMEA
jgi:DegV family protein with EDD domain